MLCNIVYNMINNINVYKIFETIINDVYRNNDEELLLSLHDFDYAFSTLTTQYTCAIEIINNIKDEMLDVLLDFDDNYLNNDKESNKYYLATPYKSKSVLSTENANIIIHNSISREFFMNFKFVTLNFYINSLQYLHPASNKFSYKSCKLTNQVYIETLEIIKTTNEYNETGAIIIKTFWLKLIQRTWKKIYKERIKWIKKNYSIQGLHFREINGRNKYGHIPTIIGMLSYLNN